MNFVTGHEENITVQDVLESIDPSHSGREAVRILAIGSRSGVQHVIARSHQTGFVEVGQWSRLLPTGRPNEFMSVVTLYLPRD